MKISVLMTVYNADKMLKKSIQAILDQTYENFEFIIINDGSEDSSAEIIQIYADNDPRITFVNRKENKGRRYSLNEGLKLCEGEWIAINDADDVSDKKRFAEAIKFSRVMNIAEHFGVIGSASKTVDILRKTEKVWKVKYLSLKKNKIGLFRIFYSMPLTHSTFFYRRSALLEVGGFSNEVTAAIDYLTLLKIAVNHPIYATNQVLVDRYVDGNNYFLKKKITSQHTENKKIIYEWEKEHYPHFRFYSLLKIIVDKIKNLKQLKI